MSPPNDVVNSGGERYFYLCRELMFPYLNFLNGLQIGAEFGYTPLSKSKWYSDGLSEHFDTRR